MTRLCLEIAALAFLALVPGWIYAGALSALGACDAAREQRFECMGD